MYVVYPGESQVVEANPDPIGLKAKNKLKEYELEPFNMAASTLNKETRSTALTTNVGQAGEEVKKFFKKVKDSGEQAIQKVTGKEVFRSDHSTMTPPPTSSAPPRPPFPQNLSRDEMSQLTDDNNNSVHPNFNFNSNFNGNNNSAYNNNSLPPFMTNNNHTSYANSAGGVTSGLRPFDKKSGAGMTSNDPITSNPSANPSSSNNASSAASKLFSNSGFGGIDNTNATNTTTTTTSNTKGVDKNYGNNNGNSNGFGNNYNNAGGGVSSSNLSAMSAKPTNTTTAGNTNSNFGNTNAFNANSTSTYNAAGNINNNYSSNANANANSGYNNATYIPSTPLSSPIPPPVKTQKEKEWEETLARIKRDREQGKSLGMEPPGGGKVDAQCSVCVIT
eukprot:gene25321-30575_t